MAIVKKIRFYLRLFFAIVKKQYLIISLSCLIGIFFYIFYPKIIVLLPEPKKLEKIGIVGQFSLNDLPDEILNDISFGLTTVNNKGEVLPNIAESWTATDEGKIYTIKLSNNKFYWHDGKIFTPNDINYNFQDATSTIENNNLIIKLKEAYSPLPTILSRPLFRKGLIGLGNYKVKKILKKGSKITGISLSSLKGTNLPDKIYRFYNNDQELKNGFNLGEINKIIDSFNTDNLYIGSSVKVTEKIQQDIYIALFFNTNSTFFSDKTFRQALSYAIPKEKGLKRSLGPINQQSWAYNPDVKPYILDLVKAKKTIIDQKVDLTKLNINISAFPQYEFLANLVKESWEELGIKSEIKIISYIPDTFDVLIIGRHVTQDPDQYYFWHSTQEGNITGFKSPRIDKLLEDGRKTSNIEERKTIYFDFQRFLVEESPAVFLIHPTMYDVIRE